MIISVHGGVTGRSEWQDLRPLSFAIGFSHLFRTQRLSCVLALCTRTACSAVT